MTSTAENKRPWWPRSSSRPVSRSRGECDVDHDIDVVPSIQAQQLAQLNATLASLASIFPDVQHEVLREMLGSFPEESRIQVIIENLLKNKSRWVKGRWRVPEMIPRTTNEYHAVGTAKNNFRNQQYKDAVRTACYQEFKGLSRSTIKGVLAEKNYFYLDARRYLTDLAANSWRQSVSNIFTRRKPRDNDVCPLIFWRTCPDGATEPSLVPSTCEELNQEIESLIIAPLKSNSRRAQISKDQVKAEALNEEEAHENNATYDCGVCFCPNSFERTTTCASSNHYICFECAQRAVSEALYGQGWAQSIDAQRWSLRCIAVGAGDECQSFVHRHHLQTALCSNMETRQLWDKFEERANRETIAPSSEDVIKCPACSYAEIDGDAGTRINAPPHPLIIGAMFVLRLGLMLLNTISTAVAYFVHHYHLAQGRQPRAAVRASRYRQWLRPDHNTKGPQNLQCLERTTTRPPLGQKFICRNPACLRVSCLICSSTWTDPHLCRTSSSQTRKEAFEHFVSARITEAIKRVCPNCSTSFVKASGCNKLTCPCGHMMCNLCRADLTPGVVGNAEGKGYSHFCPHFRATPGDACTDCNRCELYRDEADDEVIQQARREAVEEWHERVGEIDEAAPLEQDAEGSESTRKGKARRRIPWLGG